MNFPKFWALGTSGDFVAWRWSDTSMEEAQAAARDAAARVEAAFRAAGDRSRLERYGYGDRPLREPVLSTILDDSGATLAVVTRNSYGCDVLNAANALFVDVDLPEPKGGGLLGSLFGKKPQTNPAFDAAVAKAASWAQANGGWNWRIYRTKAGLRLLATHAQFDPKDQTCVASFDAVGADPLYRKLCENQQSFRARLTPKPWRCGVSLPPARWPFQDDQTERAFDAWNGRYANASASRATCKLLSEGNGSVIPALQPIVDLHDKLTRATSELPLA